MARSHELDQRFMTRFDNFWSSFGALPRFGSAIYDHFLIISGALLARSHDSDQRFLTIFDHFWSSFGALSRFGSAIYDLFLQFLEVFWSAPTIRISDLCSVLIISEALLARSHDSDQKFMSVFDHFWSSFGSLPYERPGRTRALATREGPLYW